MRHFAFIFISFMISFSGFTQNYIPYYNLIHDAEYDIFNEDFGAALEKINQAFELEEPLAKDCYLLAYCLDHMDPEANRLEVIRLLLYGSTKPGFTMRWFQRTPLLNDFDEPLVLTLWDNIASSQRETEPIIDTLNYFTQRPPELSKLFADSISVYYDSDHQIFQKYLSLLNRHDSLMQVQFLTYVKENGYPGVNTCGTSIANGLLRNMSEPVYEEYKTVLFDALKKGEIDPYLCGAMVDGHGCFYNKQAFYGVVLDTVCLPSLEQILENRISIGMSTHFRGSRHYLFLDERWLLEITE